MDGYSPQQLQIAQVAVAVGEQHGAPPNIIVAALMAASQESSLRNLSNDAVEGSSAYAHDGVGGDHDSVGPWQMRASVWGEAGIDQLMNPVYQANWFYSQADKVPGAASMDPGELAQIVEVSDFPDRYGTHRREAEALYAALRGAGSRLPQLASGPARAAGATERPGCGESPAGGSNFGQAIVAAAERWLGMPYVWGGGDTVGPTTGLDSAPEPGFDCSGLTLNAVFAASHGTITLDHTTGSQVVDPHGVTVDSADKQPGDLLFFGAGVPHHVAIYVGKLALNPGAEPVDTVVHAPDFGTPVQRAPLWTTEPMVVRRIGPKPTPSEA
ncbi:hypothetical protein A9X06_15840 [Mycobacterium sp. 852002-51759_SCH5129042]|nr:hypothetical protein A9X06_15840 [Mycobacterium sp. 852002-51759_SCH5129042]